MNCAPRRRPRLSPEAGVRAVRWTGEDGQGLEHCVLTLKRGGLVLEGMVAGNREGDSYGAHYIVRADAQGRTREVRVRYAGSYSLHVTADGEGNWHDEQRGRAIPRLRGCIDVDIGATAATNTLPIRRLGLAIGEACAISAAYVPLPGELAGQLEGAFLPEPVDQRYTRLGDRLWRYEGLFRDFVADLPVDDMGLVLDYPQLFRRAPLGGKA